jgi:hypothetical protein
MTAHPDRRSFLAASSLSAGALAFLDRLPAVSAADAQADPNLVRIDSGIEPLVRLVEETPRDKLLEEVGARIKKGLAYRDVLTALLLAGVRNVPPRPTVGFKFHAVLVVNSAHLAALAGPDNQRWLPLFWALDNFKNSQAQAVKENNGWRMKSVDEARLPSREKGREAWIQAMDNWDEEAADAATAALARTATPAELFELFARYGCRDFRDIGHKAIYVANGFRALEVIGWQHAEPVLRSMAYALLQHEGENPAKRDGEPDRCGRRNAELARKIKPGWSNGQTSDRETSQLLAASRTASDAELCESVVAIVNGGVSPQTVWDGLFLAGGELLMRQPGIVALHSLTSLNALHYAFEHTTNEADRKLFLLQAAAFVPLFRGAMKGRGKVGENRIDELQAEEGGSEVTAGQVYSTLSRDKTAAARMALGLMKKDPRGAKQLIDAGRLLIFLKGTDSHDYKFSSAAMEDSSNISPAWRDRFLAASLFWLKGSGAGDSPIVKRTMAALA